MIVRLFIQTSIVFIFIFLPIFSIGQAELKKMVQDQFSILKVLAKEPGANLEFAENNAGSHSIMAGRKVVVNLRQLGEIINSVGEIHATDLVRLVLAHELAHQMQYRFYGRVFNILLNECQADIIAGYLLLQLKGQDYAKWMDEQSINDSTDPRIHNRLNGFINDMLAVLTVIFDLGDTYIDNDHPRNEERRRAVREGISYGNLWLISSINNDPNIPWNKKSATIAKERELKDLLGYLPGDDLITWSLRQSKKIVHHPRFNSKDIVVSNAFQWHKSAEYPYVSYRQKLMNIGNNTITINFFNQVNTISRKDPGNSLYWDLRTNKAYSVTLKPGASRVIEDRLMWVATDSLMPSFNYLGSENSLYYCTSLDDQEIAIKTMSHQLAPVTIADEENILDVIFSERSNIENHIISVGTVPAENDFSSVYYNSNLRLSSADKTVIVFDRDDKAYSFQFFWEGKNIDDLAFKKRDQLFETLRQNGLVIDSILNRGNTGAWDVLENRTVIARVFLIIESNSIFSLNLKIYSN